MVAIGRRGAWLVSLLALATACGGASPASPTSSGTAPNNAGVSEFRIAGLPESLAPGASAQLKAEVVLLSGVVKECTAAWSVDDTKVANISSSGLLTAVAMGYASVTASCSGMTARVEAKVEARNPYEFDIAVRDSEWGGIVEHVTMEFLDGPRRGEKVQFDNETQVKVPVWPVRARFTADDYRPMDVVLSESTADEIFSSPISFALFWVRMVFVPDPATDTYTGKLNPTAGTAVYSFTMREPGSVKIRSWWDCDNDFCGLFAELWCGGQMLRREAAPYKGGTIVQGIQSQASCELKIGLYPRGYEKYQYRVAITYPH
jgi:hypothetical protein